MLSYLFLNLLFCINNFVFIVIYCNDSLIFVFFCNLLITNHIISPPGSRSHAIFEWTNICKFLFLNKVYLFVYCYSSKFTPATLMPTFSSMYICDHLLILFSPQRTEFCNFCNLVPEAAKNFPSCPRTGADLLQDLSLVFSREK